MNNILNLKGSFEQKKRTGRIGPPKLPSNTTVKVAHLKKLKNDLMRLIEFWEKENIFSGALISVYYNKVVAKSNRIKALLSKGSSKPNSSVVGARFSDSENPKHIITHYVQKSVLVESLTQLEFCIEELENNFNGIMTTKINESINSKTFKYQNYKMAKIKFLQIIVDSHYIEKFDVMTDIDEESENSIVTIFKTDNKTLELLKKLGIYLSHTSIIDETTILLTPDDLKLLRQKAPYLISMAVSDLAELDENNFDFASTNILSIPSPSNEPTIGVIDTLFDENVYFCKWVEYFDMVSNDIPKETSDFTHGTMVSSIIVDGPSFNTDLDDGCGRFKVRHFGVAVGKKFSSFSIIKQINEIVKENRDIKVWNLSLGSKLEINKNFISPEAALLDKIQCENDVIFVIAGTNNISSDSKVIRIGAPADSINGLVVNSVNFDKEPAIYSRKGPVLSFFTKPDISYYGGDNNKPMRVCTSTGEKFVVGTSFAAPWIARKMSYLIDILGLNREVAKALIIHSSTSWMKQNISPYLIGHGTVPIRIEDIVNSPDDEIQFILSGISEEYDTYNYRIPVPIFKEKHPFIVKATLCYFPTCSRNQGVDYTNTELDLYFGRINNDKIKSINDNYQSTENESYTLEEEARNKFKKCDNVKHIRELIKDRKIARKAYPNGNWGITLKTKEQLEEKHGKGLKFGIIVSLKEIYGVNRIEEFIQHCFLRGWIVNRIEVQNKIDIYNKAENTIVFDEL
ncbi:MAG: S8 family peptidase [Fusobacteriaceae bacterium]